jgi:hypothetical protein
MTRKMTPMYDREVVVAPARLEDEPDYSSEFARSG